MTMWTVMKFKLEAHPYFVKKDLTLLHVDITKTCLFKYTEIFTTKKWKFSDKNSNIFHISAQNIDCWFYRVPTIYVFEQK